MKETPVMNFGPREILYEDDAIIVVNKPSGLPSQATLDPSRDHCYAAVLRYFGKSCDRPYAGLHHRLDVQTSGALLLTKQQAVNASISEQFQTHTIRKTYCAICTASSDTASEYLRPGNFWCIDAPIGELPGSKIQKFSTQGKKRKPAQTEVRCVQSFKLRDGVIAVYECSPLTGRTHQIRVHLSSLGLGIIGDTLYGNPNPRSIRAIVPDRMCLHAQSLEFSHPVTGERMTVSAPLPDSFAAFLKKLEKTVPTQKS